MVEVKLVDTCLLDVYYASLGGKHSKGKASICSQGIQSRHTPSLSLVLLTYEMGVITSVHPRSVWIGKE